MVYDFEKCLDKANYSLEDIEYGIRCCENDIEEATRKLDDLKSQRKEQIAIIEKLRSLIETNEEES